jgi:hypothetical protein
MNAVHRHRRSISVALGLLMTGLLFTAAPAMAADMGDETDVNGCSYGDALAVFNAFPAVFLHDPTDEPWPVYPDCQYRMWDRGNDFTFHDDDWFLAGAAYAYDYVAAGVTREEAIAELDRYSDRLWLTKLVPGTNKAAGASVEQPVLLTAYIDAVHPEGGLIVIRQAGAILQLPAGDYLSYNEVAYQGKVVWRARVTLHILPSD